MLRTVQIPEKAFGPIDPSPTVALHRFQNRHSDPAHRLPSAATGPDNSPPEWLADDRARGFHPFEREPAMLPQHPPGALPQAGPALKTAADW